MTYQCTICKEEFEESGDGQMHVAFGHCILVEIKKDGKVKTLGPEHVMSELWHATYHDLIDVKCSVKKINTMKEGD